VSPYITKATDGIGTTMPSATLPWENPGATKKQLKKHLSPSRRRGARMFFAKRIMRCNHPFSSGWLRASMVNRGFHFLKGFAAQGNGFAHCYMERAVRQNPESPKIEGSKTKKVDFGVFFKFEWHDSPLCGYVIRGRISQQIRGHRQVRPFIAFRN